MALRVLLVGLVACLGFDLPSVEQFAGWKGSSREWVDARLADLSSLRADAERAWNGTTDREPGREVAAVEGVSGWVDLAFEAAVEGMASGFSADLAAMGSPRPVEVVASAVETEIEVDPAPVIFEGPASAASRLERISTAVRLTRQAVDAWASLIQPTADPAADDRVDSL